MSYLYWYVGVGVVVLACVYGPYHLKKQKESETLRALLDAVNPDRKKLSYRIVNNVVAPVLTTIFLVALWPIASYMMAKDFFQKKYNEELPEDKKFSLGSEHLLQPLTVEEIEKREIVTDPLRAVPQLPFGHLNAAWGDFLKNREIGSELWSFSARWQTTLGRKELRCGYVSVKDQVPGSYFLTVCKDVSEEVANDPGI